MSSSSDDISHLLFKLGEGDESAMSELIPLVYKELRRLAASHMRRERPDHTLQPTALVNEAFLRLVKQPKIDWRSRSHFFGVAARLMREILIEHARRRGRAKRGAGRKLSLDDGLVLSADWPQEALLIDAALSKLETVDGRQSEIVKMRLFGGCTNGEIAHLLDISPKTVQRDWVSGRAFLKMQLAESGKESNGKRK